GHKSTAAADAEAAAFGALQQHHADQGEHYHQMDNDDHVLHQPNPNNRSTGFSARGGHAVHIGIRGGLYTIAGHFSTLDGASGKLTQSQGNRMLSGWRRQP